MIDGLTTDFRCSLSIGQNIRVIPHSIHSDDGNPTNANIKQALRQVTCSLTRVFGSLGKLILDGTVSSISEDSNLTDSLLPCCYALRRFQGFTAALAVLVTGASQSRQHDRNESIYKGYDDFAKRMFQLLREDKLRIPGLRTKIVEAISMGRALVEEVGQVGNSG
ncbi:hypothetical protein Tco_0891512 [Tanacetum coccineum]|uniref:Uncharacterized protein n=1 Tax=Tanacetum coccineum TaxID=301880 RepID=A0ABQ5C3G1_9ASTR